MSVAIYVRVSSSQQETRSQEQDLKNLAGNEEAKGEKIEWFRDKASGTNFDRADWKRLEVAIATGRITKLVVWRLDRLGRTAGETIMLLDRLEKLGVGFLSLRDGFDPSTPAGRLQRNILASVAQFETEVRRERQLAGISAAKAAGKKWGGRKAGTRITLTHEKEILCRKLKAEGETVAAISRNLGLSRKTVYQALGRCEPNSSGTRSKVPSELCPKSS
jgi:DNA invertase Pin-like site-specific DNA recombinase